MACFINRGLIKRRQLCLNIFSAPVFTQSGVAYSRFYQRGSFRHFGEKDFAFTFGSRPMLSAIIWGYQFSRGADEHQSWKCDDFSLKLLTTPREYMNYEVTYDGNVPSLWQLAPSPGNAICPIMAPIVVTTMEIRHISVTWSPGGV